MPLDVALESWMKCAVTSNTLCFVRRDVSDSTVVSAIAHQGESDTGHGVGHILATSWRMVHLLASIHQFSQLLGADLDQLGLVLATADQIRREGDPVLVDGFT